MGSCHWLKTIISSKKMKEDRSKQGKPLSSNSPKCSSKESISFSKGKSSTKSHRQREVMQIQDIAALRIQTAFRRYLARKALKRLRAIGRCRSIMTALTGDENQACSTLKHAHFWTKMQAEIKARRLGMVNEGRRQQKLQENRLKLDAKLQELELEWCGGSETMEEILQRIQHREVAAVKRERAMAYAFSHQWRANSSQYFGQAYYDLGKDSWGWSWKERWIAVRPWETRVQANSVNSKKIHSRMEDDKVGKSANHAAMRIIVTVKPTLPNGKDLAQARKLSAEAAHIDEKQASEET